MDYGYASTTTYGAQGGNTGGGFMPGSQTDPASASNKRSYKMDSLRPVTIKQLLDAHHPHPDAEHFIIDGAETTQVTFVGQVRNISAQTTNVTYKIDDGTGIIEVKVWIDAEASTDDGDEAGGGKRKVVEQGYARVYGRMKAFNNKRHVGASVVRPVDDFNEVNYHLLEATVVHLHFAKGPLEAMNGQAQSANGNANGQMAMANGGDVSSSAGLGPAARKVYACLKSTPQTNEGLHAHDVAARLGMEISEVMKAGDELVAMGKVYTTVDDMTWALLDI